MSPANKYKLPLVTTDIDASEYLDIDEITLKDYEFKNYLGLSAQGIKTMN